MKHIYQIEGMTCNHCVMKVRKALEQVDHISQVEVELTTGQARIGMDRHIDTSVLQLALTEAGNYSIQESDITEHKTTEPERKESLFRKLFPLLLVFAYLLGMTALTQMIAGEWNTLRAMQNFMGGFFIVFSFFKFLDLRGFADAFSSYDLITRQWKGYGYLYPFVELGLGIAYLSGVNLFLTNIITLVVVSIGTIGVANALLDKHHIQCACLGTVFNLPMTRVTLTENSLMIVMAIAMLWGMG